ncbi:MAG: RraA family protein [Candidatus Heimdallarchaeota archaeon]|nr:RraA family protein [Candidatus Heimdallarchaeota archaeon]
MLIPKDYLEILQRVNTTNISDAMDKLRIHGVLEGINCMNKNAKRVFGRAVTVKLTNKRVENPAHLGIDAIELANKGNVIVMANEGRTEMACWGGILSTAASVKGISTVIIDGACRDIDEINELEFSVYAKGVSLRTARNRVYQEALNVPIKVDDVQVKPSDIIVADKNGVICIPQEYEGSILSQAWELYQLETDMIAKIKSGTSIAEVDRDVKYNDLLNMKDES